MIFKKRVNGSWTDTSHYIHNTSTDIITTLPAVLYPNAVTATVGLKGNMEQSSQPSPTTPIQPQETGERTGNLFDYSTVTLGKYINANGEEAVSSGSDEQTLNHTAYISIISGQAYTLKVEKARNHTSNSNAFCWFNASKQLITRDLFDVDPSSEIITGTYTAPNNAAYLIINYRGMHGDTGMLNTGSTPLPYEPYGYFIEIEVS